MKYTRSTIPTVAVVSMTILSSQFWQSAVDIWDSDQGMAGVSVSGCLKFWPVAVRKLHRVQLWWSTIEDLRYCEKEPGDQHEFVQAVCKSKLQAW